VNPFALDRGRHGFQDGIWADALAFAIGLGLAWWQQWATRDLVWSLWLSSLVVGWSIMGWTIFGPMVFVGTKAWQDRALLAGTPAGPAALGGAAFLVGGSFLLAFFTVHFGFFHFVHSVFLQSFFPVGDRLPGEPLRAAWMYSEVLSRYWIFLPAAFLAERQAFRFPPASMTGPAVAPDVSVTPQAIAERKRRNAQAGGMTGMMAPYRNVVRMHLLIFFFAAAHFGRFDNFAVFAVVYAVYFFPWRVLRRAPQD